MACGNGTFVTNGAAGGMLLATSLIVPQGAVAYDTAAGFTDDIVAGGRLLRPSGSSYGLTFMRIAESAGTPLLALADNSNDGSAADTVVFTTAAPAANQVGLPSNFGPGRGRWTQALVAFQLCVEIRERVNTVAGISNVGGPEIRTISYANGNFTVAVKNMSEVALANFAIIFRVRHSIES